MALGSPGVEVQVIDESFYTPAAPGTVPMIFIATAQDKKNASGSGTAQGTTAANAGKVWVITSQRDLTDTFGTPTFYTDGTKSVHGGELNEYGLQAAYSLLGVSSQAYIVRADLDLSQLTSQTSVPTGDPVSGTYWLDTDASLFGLFEWSSTTKKFTKKDPLIINNDNRDDAADTLGVPKDSFGRQGDYALFVTSDNSNQFYYKTTATTNAWVTLNGGFDGKSLTISPHYEYPTYTPGSTADGSVWIKTTTPGLGANWNVKYYNGSTQTWNNVTAPIYKDSSEAIKMIDYAGGGKNIAVGQLFIEYDFDNSGDPRAQFRIHRRTASGSTTIVSAATSATNATTSTFLIRETLASSTVTWSASVSINIPGSTTTSVASLLPAAISAAGLKNINAVFDPLTNKVRINHLLGGNFQLTDSTGSPLSVLQFSAYNMVTKTGTPNLYSAPGADGFTFMASNWKPLSYVATDVEPTTDPEDGRLWYDANLSQVDIMVCDNVGGVSKWVGYKNYSGYTGTDPNGPLVSAIAPTTQSDGVTDLRTGDVWISVADPDMYGKNIYIWDADNLEWVLQNVADNTSPEGWLFADARWGTDGSKKTPGDVVTLLTSNYVDPDVPDPALYPKGLKLWNTRRSGFNVKKYIANHLNLNANQGLNIRYDNDNMTNYVADRWVTVSLNNEDGSGSFGRHAQRSVVVKSLKALVDTNQAIRDTDTLVFNLIATPGYPELIANMVGFNTEIGYTGFVVGDSPFRLKPNGTDLTAWGNNTNLAYDNGETGLITADEYLGVFYPSGYTTDNAGNRIVVPSSHMMLRTIVNSDAKSYQWFAPAGTRRGGVDNATSVGYVDSEGEFKTVSLHERLRNTLFDINVNPIATLPGVGIVNFGQKTRAKNASALDRINVARLVCYLRRQLSTLAKPYLFEPNDAQTRREIKAAAESLLLELVGQRALYDFIVVCDESNNTPTRIDKNELWMDIAIEPVKAVEFIYIPLRIKNTGEIASGA